MKRRSQEIGQDPATKLLWYINENIAELGALAIKGVASGVGAVIPSDTEDLVNPGWIQPRISAGAITVTDMYGNVVTLDMDQKEVSLFRVRKVWSSGTDSNLGIFVYY
jgi:hypothetical protein